MAIRNTILLVMLLVRIRTMVLGELLLHERTGNLPPEVLYEDGLKVKKTSSEDMMNTNSATGRSQPLQPSQDTANFWAQLINNDRVLGLLLQQLRQNSENREQWKNTKSENPVAERAFMLEFEDPEIESPPLYVERSLPFSSGRKFLGSERYSPVCRLSRQVISMNTNIYEYKPAYYDEVRCEKPHYLDTSDNTNICHRVGFSCVQLNRTIHITRRKYNSDCWESLTRLIPSGCECLWPKHILGDISDHL